MSTSESSPHATERDDVAPGPSRSSSVYNDTRPLSSASLTSRFLSQADRDGDEGSTAGLIDPGHSSVSLDHPSHSGRWHRLRMGVATAAALRSIKADQETRRQHRRSMYAPLGSQRVDDEGLGEFLSAGRGWDRVRKEVHHRPSEGHTDGWNHLAHMFTERRHARKRAMGSSPDRQGLLRHINQGHGQETTARSDAPQQGTPVLLSVPADRHEPKDVLDSDSDTDSEDESLDQKVTSFSTPQLSSQAATGQSRQRSRSEWIMSFLKTPSPLVKGVAKCVIAYFIASLFTYSSFLSTWMARRLPNHDPDALVPFGNLHMIATVATYFHPSRSFGSMLEADLFALAAFAYATVLSLVSMLVAEQLHDWGRPLLSNVLCVLVFLGGGMSLVGYAKVKVGKPTFSTACSLLYVSTFTVFVREGSVHLGRFETDKIPQVAYVIIAGVLIANAVCFCIWPQSATTNLVNDMSRVLNAYSTLLKVLTRTILQEDPATMHIRSDRVHAAIAAHTAAYTSLQKNLDEAQYEQRFDKRIRGKFELVREMVAGLNRLGQHLGGLRSSCSLQNELLDQLHSADAPRCQSYDQFLAGVGPHLRRLVATCSTSLLALESVTSPRGQQDVSADLFDELELDLNEARRRFQHEQTAALKLLDLHLSESDHDRDLVLVIQFVCFNLEELTQELRGLVSTMRSLTVTQQDKTISWWTRRLRQRRATVINNVANELDALRSAVRGAEDRAAPAQTSLWQRISLFLWAVGSFFRQRDVLFAIKAGFGCAVLASPAFFEATRPTFKAYKGEWSLISFMVVLSPTVGQSNLLSLHRVLGTFVGAIVAGVSYWLFPDHNIILPLIGAVFSIPCFAYIVGKPQFASSGRFVLLTFNLTALYSYNVRKSGVEVEEVAFHRTVAVLAGVVWASILNHLLWPNEARRQLVRGLSDLLLKLSLFYQDLLLFSSASDQRYAANGNLESSALETQALLPGRPSFSSPLQALELNLSYQIHALSALLVQTKHEPRLKGPFPVATFRRYVNGAEEVLDKLHSLRCVLSRPEWAEARDCLDLCRGEIRDMAGNVLVSRGRGSVIENAYLTSPFTWQIFFHLLALSTYHKSALPPYLPPARASHDAAMIKSMQPDSSEGQARLQSQLLFFGYLLAMKDLIASLEKLGRLNWELYGVGRDSGGQGGPIGSREFERLLGS